MRISQLSAVTDVPVATIKYYLREGLLHDGVLTSPTQARYDQSHVRRLQLIRALTGTAGLSVSATRELLDGIETPPESVHGLLGLAHRAVNRTPSDDVDLEPAQDLLRRYGFDACDDASKAELAEALHGIATAGLDLPSSLLDRYAGSMRDIAEAEISGVPTDSAESAMRYVVLGTVLVEPLLLALRRIAQQCASRERFGTEPLLRGHPAGGARIEAGGHPAGDQAPADPA